MVTRTARQIRTSQFRGKKRQKIHKIMNKNESSEQKTSTDYSKGKKKRNLLRQ